MKVDQTQITDILQQLRKQGVQFTLLSENPVFQPGSAPTTPPIPSPQAVNMLRNASFSHSVKSWDNTAATDDTRYECSWFYSHPNLPNQPMVLGHAGASQPTKTFTSANVSTGSDTITILNHGFGTGLAVYLTGANQPAPLVAATVYYVIEDDDDTIALATSAANAKAGTRINLTTTGGAGTKTLAYDYTLKSSANTLYNPNFAIWNLTGSFAGTAAINQEYTLDAPLTGEEAMASPGYTLYGAINCAKINQYISAPSDARLGCGLYAYQSSTWSYLTASYDISAQVRGTVASVTSRDYMIHVKTDRGFTVNTSVVTVASAPGNSDFTNGAGVILNWQKVLNYGATVYEIYRKTGATYVLLFRITNGVTTYIDNNSTLPDTVVTYPSADFTGKFAYSASIENVLTNLAIDGVSDNWDTIPYALLVPSNYNLGLTDLSLKQWIRWNVTGLTNDRFDIVLDDVYVSDDLITLTSAAGQFTSDMVGLDITLEGNGVTYTGTINVYSSATGVQVTPSIDAELCGAIVSEAGSEVNGMYSYRGTDSGFPYYNLLGKPDNAKSYAIANQGSYWQIYNIDDTTYISSDNPSFPWDVVTWTQDVGALPLPTVEQYAVTTTTIHGGAPLNAVSFDLAQVSYGPNALFSFNAQDFDGTHGVPPCVPNGSNQGGTGTNFPNPGDGQPTCVWTEEMVQVVRGIGVQSVRAEDVQKGDMLIDWNGQQNQVRNLKYSVNNVYKVCTDNGFEAHTTSTHKFFVSEGYPKIMGAFKVGQEIMTAADGEIEMTKITNIENLGRKSVVQFNLANGHTFLIGRGNWKHCGGFASHNAKPIN